MARNTADELGTVRVVVHLVGVRHRPIKGNVMKVFTFRARRVSDVAAQIHRSMMRILGTIEEGEVRRAVH